MLATSLQHVLEDDLALELCFFATGEIDLLDFFVDVPFFVRQEEVVVSAATDERFFFEATKTLFDTSA